MPSRGANPSQRSQDIEDIIDEHCTDNNLIRKVFLGGSRRGAIFYQNAIPDLLEYTEDELNNSLRRIKNQFATPKKSTTNNNKFTSDMMDESVAPNPPSPMKSLQSPDSGNRTPRKRSRTPNNGSSYRERRSSDENDDRNGFQCNFKSHAESSRPQTSPRMFVFGNHAHRQDNVSPLSTLMECASISDSRIAETIINDSNLPEESVALVTDAIEFTSRATVSGGLTTQGVGDGFIRITHEKDHFSRLDKEVTKEKKNRKAIINTLDKAIKAKREEISVAQTALAGLEEEKFKEETDGKEQCDKAEALYNLAMHCYGTLRTCTEFAVQSADTVMAAANDLVGAHLALQDAYKNGQYDKLIKAKGDEVKKQLFQKA